MKDLFDSEKFKSWQKASVPLTTLLNFLVFRTSADYPEDLQIPNGTMIISNHQHRYDPYLIYYYLNEINSSNAEDTLIRFPVTPDYMRHWFFGPFLKLFGCFDIGQTTREKVNGLLLIRTLLERKMSVLLFPEGRLVKADEEPFVFHKGVDAILSENQAVVFVLLEGMNTFKWLNFSLKPQVKIKISKLIEPELPLAEKQKLIKIFYNENDDPKIVESPTLP